MYRIEAKFGAERWYINSSVVDSWLELLGNQNSPSERDVLITLSFSLAYERIIEYRDGYGARRVECMMLLIPVLIDSSTIQFYIASSFYDLC
jgi:hypothetical protein